MRTRTEAALPSQRRGQKVATAPAVAGVAYTIAWVVGLGVWPSNPEVGTTGSQVIMTYAGHRGAAMMQSLLVHGVAAIALAVVVVALGQAARRLGAEQLSRAVVVAGVGAAAVSLLQCAIGLVLAGWVVADSDGSRAGLLFAAINRLDGIKMLALAAMAGTSAVLVRRTRVLPAWLGYTGALLSVALVVSGVGYLLLSGALAPAAFVSGPLLLLWVTGAGIFLAGSRDGDR